MPATVPVPSPAAVRSLALRGRQQRLVDSGPHAEGPLAPGGLPGLTTTAARQCGGGHHPAWKARAIITPGQ